MDEKDTWQMQCRYQFASCIKSTYSLGFKDIMDSNLLDIKNTMILNEIVLLREQYV